MSRPPAFVRPPNSEIGEQHPSSMSFPAFQKNSIPLNQNTSFNLPPKAPPPFNYKQPSNQLNASPSFSNGKYPNPDLGSMVNGHFPVTAENQSFSREHIPSPTVPKNQSNTRISPALSGTNSGNESPLGFNNNATINPNHSNNVQENKLNAFPQRNHKNFPSSERSSASPAGEVNTTVMPSSAMPGIRNTSPYFNMAGHDCTTGKDTRNESNNQQGNVVKSQAVSQSNSVSSSIASMQSVMPVGGQRTPDPTSMASGHQKTPTVPSVGQFPMLPTNVTLPQQNKQTSGTVTPSNATRSPYTPVANVSVSTPYFFQSTQASGLKTKSLTQPTISPSFQQPISMHNSINSGPVPSSNLELQNKSRCPVPVSPISGYTTMPSPLAQQMPIVSPASNISSVKSPFMGPPTPAFVGPSNFAAAATQPVVPSATAGFPRSMPSPTMAPFMRTPPPTAAPQLAKTKPPPISMASVQQIRPPPISMSSLQQNRPPPISMAPLQQNRPPPISMASLQQSRPPPISMAPLPQNRPPMFSPTPTGFKGAQGPPIQSPLGPTNISTVPPPPTSFPMQSSAGYIPSSQQSSASEYATRSASYPAQYSSSQTTNVGTNKYPVQQQPTSVNQLSRQLDGFSVTQQGWNKGWGTTSVDLLQQRWVLPPGGVVPPKPWIAQENAKTCSPDTFRCTFTKVPESSSVLQKVRLPFGILVHPFKDVEQLTIVNGCTIVRCRSCRTYINPFIVFKGERKWECNLCFRVNELPEEFQYDPVSRTYGDPSRRPECKEATIEYIAPQEYLLRPPQPACYLYVLDTSRQAIETGYLQIVCEILLSRLNDIPGDRRTLIGFITYSTSVQFYMIAEDQKMVNVLDVGDIKNMFLPSPQDLLVNLNENRELVEELLMNLPENSANTRNTETCLGAAITAAHKLLAPIGGRITVMAATLPTLGPGSLKSREDPNQRAAKEIYNLGPATDFYKKFALDCSAQQIAVDLFTFNSQYIDLATISGISKFSGGCIHHYPGLNLAKNTPNVVQFRNCFDRYVIRKIGFEAVMRIRATRGLAITNFHGNFFVRSTDLLSLPNINPDAGFGMQVIIEEPLHNIRQACFQAALLYTSSNGERRIRVHTMCLPVCANILDILITADQQAIVGFLSKLAVDRCLISQMSDAREAVVNACSDALGACKLAMTTSVGLGAPISLQLLPMYCLAILKSISLRYGTSTKLDDRVFAMCELKSLPLRSLIKTVYPDLYAIHNLTEKGAISVHDMVVAQPARIHLSSEFLDRSGAYLMDAGDVIIIYIRSYIHPNWLNDVLGIPNFAAIPQPMHDDPLPQLDNPASELVRNFVSYLQMDKPYSAPLSIIKEDSPERYRFMQSLIEDRSEASHSYVEFLQYVKSQIK